MTKHSPDCHCIKCIKKRLEAATPGPYVVTPELLEFIKHAPADIKLLLEMLEDAEDYLLDCFGQACSYGPSDNIKYDHRFLSAYENAQHYLIKRGYIKPEECVVEP